MDTGNDTRKPLPATTSDADAPRRSRAGKTMLWLCAAVCAPLVLVWVVYGTVSPCGILKRDMMLYMSAPTAGRTQQVLGPMFGVRWFDSLQLSPVQCAIGLVNRKLPEGKKISLRWSLFSSDDAANYRDDGYRE